MVRLQMKIVLLATTRSEKAPQSTQAGLTQCALAMRYSANSIDLKLGLFDGIREQLSIPQNELEFHQLSVERLQVFVSGPRYNLVGDSSFHGVTVFSAKAGYHSSVSVFDLDSDLTLPIGRSGKEFSPGWIDRLTRSGDDSRRCCDMHDRTL
jgi:hypothetical protein